jgi:hypothetical protein
MITVTAHGLDPQPRLNAAAEAELSLIPQIIDNTSL